MPSLYPDQEDAATRTAIAVLKDKKVIFQLSTGGGKTAIGSTITQRFITKNNKRVLILVHREELLKQFRKTLFDWHGIIAYPITKETKVVPDSMVYVGMVETVYRRVLKNKNYLPEMGLTFIDECHIGNFFKMIPNLSGYLIGLTATPLSAKKTDPLKNYFNSIVCGPSISELIQNERLAQNITYRPKFAVNPDKFHIKNGEYDPVEMATEFSKGKHIKNVVEQYELRAKNKKCMVFNCNIAHSKLVTNAFLDAGYNARHIDGGEQQRSEVFTWFKNTPDAILCNVGIATTGFDEPSIECIIMNRSTLSLPLAIQCWGRGGRITSQKDHFIIIDMGGNVLLHGDWSDDRNWEDLFYNPPKKSDKLGVAPVKDCPECEAVIPAQMMICKYCNYEFPVKEEVYDAPIDLVLNIKPVQDLIEQHSGKKEFYTFFNLGYSIATQAKYKSKDMNDATAKKLLDLYESNVSEWCELKNRKFNRWIKELAKNHLYTELKKIYPLWHPQA